MSMRKKTLFIELIFIILINVVLLFVFIEVDLFQRFYHFTQNNGLLKWGELLLLCISILLSTLYIFARLWRKSVIYARLTKHSASKDPLTKLLNRGTLEHALATEWDRYLRYHEDFCLVLFDVDDFSDINENLGHIEGDRVLMDIAQKVSLNTRKTDSVARWGEEEFLILCPVCKAEQGAVLAEKLRAMIYRTLKDGIELSASFAVVQSKPTQSFDDLMKRADFTLHKAKKRGKNCVVTG
ncbi:hypothetical protein GCM10007916_37040 [Psychromonas marina]|uniref:diguanylate cyclase n=1 Tax=Psychromonas marina TaxID=88364 RepID=A0ABQ6E5B3_9GAMM|nr:GGDEF domain-containing protein [Psychromonas marina]GLS92632.1 hypothetical protein GCM10007916_37040 [Psychromonas marina]